MSWVLTIWRAIVAWLSYRAGAQAGAAEAHRDDALQAAKEKADVAEAIAAAVVAAPRDRTGLTGRLRRGAF